jgi:hypothetical protein
MSDILKFKTNQPGELERLTTRLYSFPRTTDYQRLCFGIAQRALDLPAADWHGRDQGKLLRHLDQLDAMSVQRWLLAAADINDLAAMVMVDAIDLVCDCWRFLTGDDHDCLGPTFKSDFTKSVGGLPFVFRIPSSWELSLFHDKFDEGNYSVGRVLRCHLSESSTHENWGLGHLAGKDKADYSGLGYFDVPCAIVPHFKRSPIDEDDERWRMGTVSASIPYQWIIQVRTENHETRKKRLEPVPGDDEILSVADRAADAVRAQFDEIGRKIRERHEVAANAVRPPEGE